METIAVDNKGKFLEIVDSISRAGMNRDMLKRQLLESDFFTAPASAKYHCNWEGGLVEHSLNVYYNLVKLNETFGYGFDEDTMKIVGLFHDFSKMNYYCPSVSNKKIYSESGTKCDNLGRFDWVSVQSYGVMEPKDRFIFSDHENTSAYMTNTFIPLTIEEYTAIAHHHGGQGFDSNKGNLADIWIKYPLALALFQADCIAAFGADEYRDE